MKREILKTRLSELGLDNPDLGGAYRGEDGKLYFDLEYGAGAIAESVALNGLRTANMNLMRPPLLQIAEADEGQTSTSEV